MRTIGLLLKYSTASRRWSISFLSISGADKTFLSIRLPKLVLVLSSTHKRLPRFSFERIVSNNSSVKRVREFAEKLGILYVARAKKPLKGGFKKAIKLASRKYNNSEIMAIGDQLMTDVFAANRMNYVSVLVKAIDRKTEKWTTRFNRMLEKHVLRRIIKRHNSLYEEKLKVYKEENYGRD